MHSTTRDPVRSTAAKRAAVHKRRLVLIAVFWCFCMLPCSGEATGQKSYTITWNNQSYGPCHPLSVQTKVAALYSENFEDKDVLLHNTTRSMTFSPATVLKSGVPPICTMQLSSLCYYRGSNSGVPISSPPLPCSSGTATITTAGITLTSP